MRKIVTGVDSNGASCVIEEIAIPVAGAKMGAQDLFNSGEGPPRPRPQGHGESFDSGVGLGAVRWYHIQWPPGAGGADHMHYTDTIDFAVVVEGNLDLLLDDGPHALEPGDCAVVAGVNHGWKVGPKGCTVTVLCVGTPPPKE